MKFNTRKCKNLHTVKMYNSNIWKQYIYNNYSEIYVQLKLNELLLIVVLPLILPSSLVTVLVVQRQFLLVLELIFWSNLTKENYIHMIEIEIIRIII